jgi:hypothetical protein
LPGSIGRLDAAHPIRSARWLTAGRIASGEEIAGEEIAEEIAKGVVHEVGTLLGRTR